MYLGDKCVDLKNLTMPLLNFYGKFDHLVPPEACEQLTKAVGSKDVEDICLETGHIGIYVSSKFQKQFAPKIAQWLKERDEKDIPVKREQTHSKHTRRKQSTLSKATGKAESSTEPLNKNSSSI
jgi:polyhydroxyalkanoate synthase